MKGLDKATINVKADIGSVMRLINDNSLQIALVVDNSNKLLGTITDGDIRRALLAGMTLASPIEPIIFRNPTVG